jgi:hypothetical protein
MWVLLGAAALAAAAVIAAARRSPRPPAASAPTVIPLPRFGAPPEPAPSRPAPPGASPPTALTAADQDARWNQLYGKVLSGTGTTSDIDAYYEHLRDRSQRALDEAQARLAAPVSERDRALLELAARMNRERLASLPAERDAARARQRRQEERRRSWSTIDRGR